MQFFMEPPECERLQNATMRAHACQVDEIQHFVKRTARCMNPFIDILPWKKYGFCMTPSSEAIIAVIRSIPPGNVMAYGEVAAAAGIHNGARMVSRILHSCSASHNLPWWRVIRADGCIALPHGQGLEEQAAALRAEGLSVDKNGRVVASANPGREKRAKTRL
jgi:methylated-DNA-protein-cysteine methyltransferase-like protein